MENKNNCMIEVLRMVAVETIKKDWLTKAEHKKISQAKRGNYLNEIMIKLENKKRLTKAEHKKILPERMDFLNNKEVTKWM